jgi:hypothetical protein
LHWWHSCGMICLSAQRSSAPTGIGAFFFISRVWLRHERVVEARSSRILVRSPPGFASKARAFLVPGQTRNFDPCPGVRPRRFESICAPNAACAASGQTVRRCHLGHWTRTYHGCRICPTCRLYPTCDVLPFWPNTFFTVVQIAEDKHKNGAPQVFRH